jgi:divalent metal cation (Fe/Co/Zn/Cd) transporter
MAGRQQLEPLAVTICATVMVAASVQVIFESVRRLVDNSITVDLGVVH